MKLRIAYLYPELMNIYGDRGNILCFLKRCQWRGIETEIRKITLKDSLLPGDFDFYFAGGGQDKEQILVAKDLQTKKKALKEEADRGVPMLLICGSYQLFGHYFKTFDDKKLLGISVLDCYTVASKKRKIGNVIVRPNKTGVKADKSRINNYSLNYLLGFENHSGNTFIKSGSQTQPLGKVIKGFGNNGKDKTGGAVYKNVLGTYLHGPILPKNPELADFLIKKALETKYQKKITLKPLDNKSEELARTVFLRRFLPLRYRLCKTKFR